MTLSFVWFVRDLILVVVARDAKFLSIILSKYDIGLSLIQWEIGRFCYGIFPV
jgi:hypothetical protein